MQAYIIRRCLQSLVVFAAILVIVFLMLQITGDPAAVLMPLCLSSETGTLHVKFCINTHASHPLLLY